MLTKIARNIIASELKHERPGVQTLACSCGLSRRSQQRKPAAASEEPITRKHSPVVVSLFRLGSTVYAVIVSATRQTYREGRYFRKTSNPAVRIGSHGQSTA